MKKILAGDSAALRKLFFRIFTAVSLCVSGSAINSFASQSSFNQRLSFNSSRQFTTSTTGLWGIDDRSFASSTFTYQAAPTTPDVGTDSFYQGALGAGYAIENFAFDAGFIFSYTNLPQIISLGGTLGLTYIFTSSDEDPSEYQAVALDALHSQFYTSHEKPLPVLWTRIGFTGNSMQSALLGSAGNSGKETALTIDVFYPFSEELLFGINAGFHGYDNNKGFFNKAFTGTITAEQLLLRSTLQGLPHNNFGAMSAWQLAPRDFLIPRYALTELDSSRKWSHTIDLGWRHQFSKNWFISPTYEISIYQAVSSSAVIFDLLYSF